MRDAVYGDTEQSTKRYWKCNNNAHSNRSRGLKSARNVSNVHTLLSHQHPKNVESVGLAGPAVAVDPGLGRLGDRTLFAAMDGLDGIAELFAGARLDLDEGDEPVALSDDVDVAAAGSVAACENLPAGFFEPASGDALAKFAELVGGFGHGREGREARRAMRHHSPALVAFERRGLAEAL